MLSVNARAARREGQAAARSLGLEAARLDQLAPFLVVRFDDAAHRTRAIGGRLETRSKQNPLRFRHCHDLGDLGIIDGIVQEPPGGAHTDHAQAAELLDGVLQKQLGELKRLSTSDLLNARYAKFRNMAQFFQVEG